jgi:TetR/AcrR family transcriptional regulator, transcriptional repressor for nem operon
MLLESGVGVHVGQGVERTGVTAASLYNARQKRSIFLTVFDRYVESSIGARVRRCETLPPREAIKSFFDDILRRSLNDRERKGCLVVNAALEMAPHDPEFRRIVAVVLIRIEIFFLKCIEAGQAEGTVARSMPARTLARHLLGVLMGVRVLARVRPERALLEGIVAPALALLDRAGSRPASMQ